MSRTRREITEAERATIKRLASEGATWKAIAQAVDRPQGTVNSILSLAILNGELPRRYAREQPRIWTNYE